MERSEGKAEEEVCPADRRRPQVRGRQRGPASRPDAEEAGQREGRAPRDYQQHLTGADPHWMHSPYLETGATMMRSNRWTSAWPALLAFAFGLGSYAAPQEKAKEPARQERKDSKQERKDEARPAKARV